MGRIRNCFIANSDEFVNLLSRNLNHIVLMLYNRGAITEEQKLSVQESNPKSTGIKHLFKYIEINDEADEFISILNKTENGGIAHFVRLAARYYFTSELPKCFVFKIGTDVVLSCEISDDYGVQWFKSGIKISANSKYNIKNNGLVRQLIILNAQTEDAGDYLCECCYARSNCTIKDIEIIESLKDSEVEKGGRLHLSCKLNANVNVKWSRNGKELSRDNQTDFDKTAVENLIKYTLTIKNVEEENSGDYSCFYENLMISCRVIVKKNTVDTNNARTTEILYEIIDTKKKLEKKQEEIDRKKENLVEMETEIKTKEQEMTAKEIEIESKMSNLALKENEIKQREMQLELKEVSLSELEKEKYLLNEYCLTLRHENEELKCSRENADMVHAELNTLREEKQKLEDRVTMLEKYIDSASDTHKRAVEDILEAQKITIAELNEKHETTIQDIRRLIQERDHSKTCAVS